jgi:vacuolar-type H+-ATPase subunit I/STV1
VQGDGELLDSLASSKLKLADVKKDQLPAELQSLSDAEIKAEIETKQKERADLQTQIVKLSKDRDAYLAAERKKLAASTKTDSFDEQVATAIRSQAAKKGISYGK